MGREPGAPGPRVHPRRDRILRGRYSRSPPPGCSLLYKVNTGFARARTHLTDAGTDGRFDVQLNQALPFELGSTKWEVLVGVRNLFRDPNEPASIYDELLVVRPPKRVVGGFLVRF